MDDKDIPLANGKVEYQTLLRESDYTVAKTTVRAGGATQWHHHTNVSDRFLVVRGVLTVETKIDGLLKSMKVRDFYNVDPGIVHHIKNETEEDVVYIMVQAGGASDIVLTPAQD
ncbi:cupin domain-containing protein [Paraburkholderia dilworthii]|uniref:cupin domain-containing protein n=1 Tax=Paraburkholderia dilworthii TaxID=948106 RepID=UPI0004190EC7|nr:cupin domain-containing protein [Paraburkholderia dilworthii]